MLMLSRILCSKSCLPFSISNKRKLPSFEQIAEASDAVGGGVPEKVKGIVVIGDSNKKE